jgi:hypothetical protein
MRPSTRPLPRSSQYAHLGPPGRVSRTAVIGVGCCQSDGVGSLKSWQTMKEAYAVRRTVPPSAEIQVEIDKLLGKGLVDDPQKMLGELARLGARLIIQRVVRRVRVMAARVVAVEVV